MITFSLSRGHRLAGSGKGKWAEGLRARAMLIEQRTDGLGQGQSGRSLTASAQASADDKLIFQTYFESRTFELSYLQKHQVGIANLLAKEQRIAWVSLGHLRFLSEIDQKVPIFVEKLKKIQPLKMTFRSQLEPSIKSYECFMFFLNFRLEMTLD